MYVTEVTSLFKEYTSEQDRTYLTSAQIQRYLIQGYDEFRRVCSTMDPNIYQASAIFPVSNAFTLPLDSGATRILGATPTQAPLQKLIKVLSVNPSNNQPRMVWAGVKDEDELYGYNQDGTPLYMLVGSSLNFNRAVSDTLKLVYTPQGSKPRNPQGVDWSKSASTDTEFIDNLDEFHDMIALYAYAQYAAREASDNVQIEKLLARRVNSLQMYLFNGRDHTGNSGHSY